MGRAFGKSVMDPCAVRTALTLALSRRERSNGPMCRWFQFNLQNMKTLLLASLIFVSATGCENRSSRTTSDAEWDAEYRKRTDAQVEEIDRQIRRVNTQQDLQAEQTERYDKLLERWERQSKRQEAILNAQEKQLGIKK